MARKVGFAKLTKDMVKIADIEIKVDVNASDPYDAIQRSNVYVGCTNKIIVDVRRTYPTTIVDVYAFNNHDASNVVARLTS